MAPEPSDLDLPRLSDLARRLHLVLDPRRQRLGGGARMGTGAGNSLEFHDYRDYQVGDDPRQVDWGVYARSRQLVLRRHRAEVQPRLELLLDASASMGVADDKWLLARQTAVLLTLIAQRDGARPRLWVADDRWHLLDGSWRERLAVLPCQGVAGLAAAPGELAHGGERVLISDGLCPEGGAAVVRRLGQGAGSLALVQILSRQEAEPELVGPLRLCDVEGGSLDLVVGAAARADYRRRLARHQAGWQAALAGRGVGLMTIAAEVGVEDLVSGLLRHGLLALEGAA